MTYTYDNVFIVSGTNSLLLCKIDVIFISYSIMHFSPDIIVVSSI